MNRHPLVRTALPVVCLGLVCVLPPTSAFSKTPKRTTALIPFQPLKDHGVPLVKVRINGTYDATFMVDTGASECVMTQKLAKDLGLFTEPAYLNGILPYGFGGDQNDVTTVKKLEFGSIALANATFIVIKTDDLFKFSEQHVDGIIGGALLSQFAMFVDFPRHLIAFITPGGLSSEEIANLRFGDTKPILLNQEREEMDTVIVPTGISRDGVAANQDVAAAGIVHTGMRDIVDTVYTVKLECSTDKNQGTEMLVVDTGAPDTSISRKLADQLKLLPIDNTTASTMFNGSDFANIASVQSVKVGDLAMPGFKVTYPSNHNSNIPSLLGENILSNCTALFDFPKRLLYLKPILPPLDGSRNAKVDVANLDRERLCNAASIEWFPTALADDEADPTAKIAALQAAMTGTDSDLERDQKLANLYQAEHLDTQSQAAFAKVVDLQRARVKQSPTDPVQLSHLAEDLANAGKLDEALQTAQTTTTASPQSAASWMALGQVLHQQSLMTFSGRLFSVDISDGLSEYRELIARLRTQQPTPDAIALAQKQSQDARTAFDKAVSLAPKDPKVYQARATFLEDDALGLQAPVKELHGDPVELLREMHSDLYLSDEDQWANLSPGDIDTQVDVANIDVSSPIERSVAGLDFREGKFWKSLPKNAREDAQTKIDRLATLSTNADPKVASRAQEALGILQYTTLEDLPTAEATLSAVVAHDPSRQEALETLAVMLSDKQRYDDLMPLLNAPLAAHDAAQTHLLLARTLIKLDHWPQAGTQIQSALNLSPERFDTNLAAAAYQLHRSGDDAKSLVLAKANLDKANWLWGIILTVNGVPAYEILQGIYLGLSGDANTAKSTILAILDDNPTNTQARDVLAALVL